MDNQQDFIYCKRTMDPLGAQHDAIITSGFTQAIQNTPQMSPEVKAALE